MYCGRTVAIVETQNREYIEALAFLRKRCGDDEQEFSAEMIEMVADAIKEGKKSIRERRTFLPEADPGRAQRERFARVVESLEKTG